MAGGVWQAVTQAVDDPPGDTTQSKEDNEDAMSVKEETGERICTSRHPCMMLNEKEKHAVSYELLEDAGSAPDHEYIMRCEIHGQSFTGQGKSKKVARARAAEAALAGLYNIIYDPAGFRVLKKVPLAALTWARSDTLVDMG
ncbi:Interleukin enhancer-binding factor 3 [Bulinus truncatus]|nr:Interleukin enhancer-binding factor 3 [Bulinus truncatus]